MANICTTQVTVQSTPSVLSWLEEQFKQITNLESEQINEKFIEMFGADSEDNIDKVGAKWITFDPSSLQRQDDENLYFVTETANHPPSDLLVNMQKMLSEKEKELEETDYATDTNIYGRYWDEAFQPIGVFSTGFGEWEVDEAYLDDIDYDDENYWDNQVEPAFDNLEV